MLTSNKISSLVIDTLRDRAAGQNIAVLGLYCDYQGQKDQLAVNMIGGLLRQVVWGAAGIRSEIRSAFNESKRRGGQGLRMQDMLRLFVKVTSSMDRVYICVDAVDELLNEQIRVPSRSKTDYSRCAKSTAFSYNEAMYPHGT